METLNLIRLIAGAIFITAGTVVLGIEMFAINKLKYTLDRMHFAGTGDTLGLASIILGGIIINGFDFTAVKLILVLVFFWFASPVSSHLISRLVRDTDERLESNCKIFDEETSKPLLHGKDEK